MTLHDWMYANFPSVQVSRGGDELSVNCPMCVRIGKLPDDGFHLGVSLSKLKWHCFRCNDGGNVERLVAEVMNITITEARALVDLGPLRALAIPVAKAAAKSLTLPSEAHEVSARRRTHAPVLDYLMKRCVTPSMVKRFDLRYCATGTYSGRLIIPVMQYGAVVGFVGRAVREDLQPKYKFPPGFAAANFLYNFDEAVLADDFVVIVEGPFDAWRLADHSVALFGKQMSDSQKALIIKNWKSVFVMLDADASDEAFVVAKSLACFVPVRVALLTGKDPWEVSNAEALMALRTATSAMRTLLT